MRVLNPNAPPAVSAADRGLVTAALQGALAANAQPTFDQIRAAIPAGARGRFNDGYLQQACQDLGLVVIE